MKYDVNSIREKLRRKMEFKNGLATEIATELHKMLSVRIGVWYTSTNKNEIHVYGAKGTITARIEVKDDKIDVRSGETSWLMSADIADPNGLTNLATKLDKYFALCLARHPLT